jgi:hypothetical protein
MQTWERRPSALLILLLLYQELKILLILEGHGQVQESVVGFSILQQQVLG